MMDRFLCFILCAGLTGTTLGSVHALWKSYQPEPRPEAVRVPYAIVEKTTVAERSSLVPVTMLGQMRPEDEWATAYGIFFTLDDCLAELGDVAWQYREKWPMAVMWCAPGVGDVAMPRPRPRPKA